MISKMEDYSKYIISDRATIKEALIVLNKLSNDILVLFVVGEDEQMVGTLTDGDIRRHLVRSGRIDDQVEKAMSRDFHYVRYPVDVATVKEYRKKQLTLVPCLNEHNRIIKAINLHSKKSFLPVDVVLMAGGRGERLRPLTEKTPKPLLMLGGKAIIDHSIDRLISFGIEHFSVTVNYLHAQIEAHFKEKKEGIEISCVQETTYLGTIGSIKFIKKFYHDTVLLMNSDLFTNIDYEDFYLYFKEHHADMAVAAVPYSISVPYGVFELDGSEIHGIKEKPTYNYYANAGIYLIKRELLEMIPGDSFYNATDFITLLVSKKRKVVRFPITGYWIDIGKHEDYQKAQEFAKHITYGE